VIIRAWDFGMKDATAVVTMERKDNGVYHVIDWKIMPNALRMTKDENGIWSYKPIDNHA
jgi:hypothetical protein